MVGLTEAEASERGIDYEVGRGWFKHSPRAQIAGSSEGLIKLYFGETTVVYLASTSSGRSPRS